MLVLFLFGVAAWIDSYAWCRQYLWGDRHRGTYTFVTSSFGALFVERRTNCDVDHKFTRNHQRSYQYRPFRPDTSRELLGLGLYAGTRYCWYSTLYPVTTFPAFTDPRWQKEPYRMVRLPYWPLILIGGATSLLFVPRRLRARRALRRLRRGLCRVCGYSLTGNTSGVCPECGQPVGAALLPSPNAPPE